jgi:hypothetical protein
MSDLLIQISNMIIIYLCGFICGLVYTRVSDDRREKKYKDLLDKCNSLEILIERMNKLTNELHLKAFEKIINENND